MDGTIAAAGLLAAAAGFHLAAIPGHADAPYVVFFTVAAGAQLVAAAVVTLRATARVRVTVLVGNGALVAIWVAARTGAVPVGPDAGVRHDIGVLDSLAVAVELAAIVVLLVANHGRWFRRPVARHGRLPAATTLGVLGLACILATGAGAALPAASHSQVHDSRLRLPSATHSHGGPQATASPHRHPH